MKVALLVLFSCVIGVLAGVYVSGGMETPLALPAPGVPIEARAIDIPKPLARFELELSCGESDPEFASELTAEEKQQLNGLIDFAQDHADEVVHLSVRITQGCAACGCPRMGESSERGPGAEGGPGEPERPFNGSLTIEHASIEQRRKRFGTTRPRMYVEGVELQAYAPSWAMAHSIFLPRYFHLEDAHYRYGEYGTFLVYDGLFVARYYGATGTSALHFDVVHPTAAQLQQLAQQRAILPPHIDDED